MAKIKELQHQCFYCGGLRPHDTKVCRGCGMNVTSCGPRKQREKWSADKLIAKDSPPELPVAALSLHAQIAQDDEELQEAGTAAFKAKAHSKNRKIKPGARHDAR